MMIKHKKKVEYNIALNYLVRMETLCSGTRNKSMKNAKKQERSNVLN